MILDENNLIIYNTSSSFYKNLCFKDEALNKIDITLYDRENDYNEKNLSLCEKNCEYIDYNIITKRVTCSCDIKIKFINCTELMFNLDILLDKIIDFKKHSNIGVLKCYTLLFNKDGLLFNLGSYILLVIIFINII